MKEDGWTTRDPITDFAEINANLAKFVANAPMNYIDQDGLRARWWGGFRDDDVDPDKRDCYNKCVQEVEGAPAIAGAYAGLVTGLTAGAIIGSGGFGVGATVGAVAGGLIGTGVGLYGSYKAAELIDYNCKQKCCALK